MKKIIATVLAMVMALALCTTAFAAETYTNASKFDAASGAWKTVDLAGATIAYTAATETKTGSTVDKGTLAYYSVTLKNESTATLYIESTKDDAAVELRMSVNGTEKYLVKVDNTAAISYTLIGSEVESSKACGKIAVAAGKTVYVSSNETEAKYYTKGSTTNTKNMLVDGKVISVGDTSTGDYTTNKHSFKLVTKATDSKGVVSGTAKCEVCGLTATITNKSNVIPTGASTQVGEANTDLAGLYMFWTEGSTTPSMQSVLIGSEYPVMDTLLFYVKNDEKLELSIIIRSRTHSSLTLCSVSRSMYCFVMPQSRPKRSRLFTSTTSTFPARTASVSSCRAGRSRVNPEPCSAATPTMVYPACSA